MKKTDIKQPQAMASAFAQNIYSETGTDNFEIPTATSTAPEDSCVLDNGFLPITSTALDDGGIAPERKNFNGLFYLSTDQRFYLQNGGIISFNEDVSNLIGGYPNGAILDYLDQDGDYSKVQSLIDDNTYNFIETPTYINDIYWKKIDFGGSPLPLFSIIMSAVPLGEVSLHLLDGALLLGEGVYASFVQEVARRYGEGETPPDYFTDEETWQNEVAEFGVCSKFVYDEENNTVRLPKWNSKYLLDVSGEQNAPVVGNGLALGLNNGTVDGVSLVGNIISAGTGGASIAYSNSKGLQAGATSGTINGINRLIATGVSTDEKYSGLQANLKELSKLEADIYYYITISNGKMAKSSIDIDIDKITADLNNKADIDGSNMISSVKKFDGGFIEAFLSIAENVVSPISSDLIFDLSSYLPEDNYNYEVLFTAKTTTGSSSSDACWAILNTDLVKQDVYLTASKTRTAATVTNWGSCNIAVGPERKVMLSSELNNTGVITLRAIGYRRIGTNE